MRIAILVFVAVFLLLGGGGAAWWFLLGPGADRTTDIFAAINKPDPVFVSVDPPLVISLIQQGEVTHHGQMQPNLMLADARNKMGRGSSRERGGMYVDMTEVAGA